MNLRVILLICGDFELREHAYHKPASARSKREIQSSVTALLCRSTPYRALEKPALAQVHQLVFGSGRWQQILNDPNLTLGRGRTLEDKVICLFVNIHTCTSGKSKVSFFQSASFDG